MMTEPGRKKRSGLLTRFLLISIGVHLFVALVLLISSLFRTEAVSAIAPSDDIDVEVVHQEPDGRADRRDIQKTKRSDDRADTHQRRQRPRRAKTSIQKK